ncbi:MAG: tRNA (N(6)-L-threonylcarbamoyladenosine(37)-C(2))-methylthiotransferase MtaB [Clostridia bacterium]|nr:tRNA (N(6)-L-threonylcarbamoyladenosine(37)-C(2))-methylthiotransferase MtaB [Clostridia bacterium]
MKSVGYMTLGCKTNQYDTQAIREAFEKNGYTSRSFQEPCDIYVVNTCTVTGTGDRKSLKMVRQANRRNPKADIIVAGCLAQKMGAELAGPQVRLVIGTQYRNDVVRLYEEAVARDMALIAVDSLKQVPYEEAQVTYNEGHTRAVMKIQEGCNNRCAYCIIPSVRGPIRSRSLEGIREEAVRLVENGFQEIVLTGIHLSSYGRDFTDRKENLASAVRAVAESGIKRIRLGSLEPRLVDRAFAEELSGIRSVCPQFHLSLQSGSDKILQAMRRQYSTSQYRDSVDLLREYFPDPAITTDVITGFPGETEEDFATTVDYVRTIGFARLHVFPFSNREGTEAAVMPQQVPMPVRMQRAKTLIEEGKKLEQAYLSSFIGKTVEVLFEENGTGLSREYFHVSAGPVDSGLIRCVRIERVEDGIACGTLTE